MVVATHFCSRRDRKEEMIQCVRIYFTKTVTKGTAEREGKGKEEEKKLNWPLLVDVHRNLGDRLVAHNLQHTLRSGCCI